MQSLEGQWERSTYRWTLLGLTLCAVVTDMICTTAKAIVACSAAELIRFDLVGLVWYLNYLPEQCWYTKHRVRGRKKKRRRIRRTLVARITQTNTTRKRIGKVSALLTCQDYHPPPSRADQGSVPGHYPEHLHQRYLPKGRCCTFFCSIPNPPNLGGHSGILRWIGPQQWQMRVFWKAKDHFIRFNQAWPCQNIVLVVRVTI